MLMVIPDSGFPSFIRLPNTFGLVAIALADSGPSAVSLFSSVPEV